MAGPPRADWGSADTATAAYWKERTATFYGIVAWSPTIDPESLKLLNQELVVGAGVHLILHGWASTPIIEEDGRVGGIVFDSKEGRLAIRAKVTIDCTGDGDIFHRAGAASDSDIDERCSRRGQRDPASGEVGHRRGVAALGRAHQGNTHQQQDHPSRRRARPDGRRACATQEPAARVRAKAKLRPAPRTSAWSIHSMP